LRPKVIAKPEVGWRAMSEVGVRPLTEVARPEVVELGDRSSGDRFHERLLERQPQIRRVVSQLASQPWPELAEEVAQLSITLTTELSIAWFLQNFQGSSGRGDVYEVNAVFDRANETIFLVERDESSMWFALARELVNVLVPGQEPGRTAAGLATVLDAKSAAIADARLNELGFPAFARDVAAVAESAEVHDFSAEKAAESDLRPSQHDGGPDAASPEDLEPTTDEPSEPETAEPETAEPHRAEAGGDADADTEHEQKRDADGDASDQTPDGGRDQDAPPHQDPADSHGTDPQRRRRSQAQLRKRLRSYVLPPREGEREPDHEAAERNAKVDAAGIERVMEYERDAGRNPKPMDHDNEGYDIESYHPDGQPARTIEVKSTAGEWDQYGVEVSPAQFRAAQDMQEEWWLYVVEHALDNEKATVWPIPNPATAADEFLFDDGWKDAAEGATNTVERVVHDENTA